MAVTLEQARLAHKLGIKQRKSDGMFGFKLVCPSCGKDCAAFCFCTETIEAAIEARQSKMKAPYACTTSCWYKWDGYWTNAWGEVLLFLDEGGEAWDELRAKVEKTVGGKRRFGMDDYRWPRKLRTKLKSKQPKLYRAIQDQYSADQEFDYEPFEEGDVTECSCEIDGE